MSRYTLFPALALLVACGALVDPVCGCSPPGGGTAVIRGLVKSPAEAPVPGATVQVRLMTDLSCVEPAVTITRSAQTDAAGEFRHSEGWSGGRKCFRVWATPPAGSPLSSSASELVRIDFLDGPDPDTTELVLQLR